MRQTIYVLCFKDIVFYVGSTGKPPEERIEEHLQKMREKKHPNKRVQAAYNEYGIPTYKILETLLANTPEEAARNETKHILYYAEQHPYQMCNVAAADPRAFEVWFPIPDEDLQWSKTQNAQIADTKNSQSTT